MNHREIKAKYATYDVKDCKESKSSLRYYKKRSHRLMRNDARKEIDAALNAE
jgi:hypothetical protein